MLLTNEHSHSPKLQMAPERTARTFFTITKRNKRHEFVYGEFSSTKAKHLYLIKILEKHLTAFVLSVFLVKKHSSDTMTCKIAPLLWLASALNIKRQLRQAV